jgi:uncharacterized protein (DUF1330 family)
MEYMPIIIALSVGFFTGFVVRNLVSRNQTPAYLVVSTAVVNDEALEPYRQEAVPLAQAAGLEILASGEAELLEGSWEHHPTITVERFDSMDALKSFWHSTAYQKAKKLRAGHLDVQFIVAVDGVAK